MALAAGPSAELALDHNAYSVLRLHRDHIRRRLGTACYYLVGTYFLPLASWQVPVCVNNVGCSPSCFMMLEASNPSDYVTIVVFPKQIQRSSLLFCCIADAE